MSTGSLRLRLMLFYALAISIALSLAGAAFYERFQSHVENLMLKEFDTHYEQLATALTFDANGHLQVENELSDPRFARQFGGLYWQIDSKDNTQLRSRSLWDETLKVPVIQNANPEGQVFTLSGPDDALLLALVRTIEIENPSGKPVKATVTIAMDRSSVSNTISAFSNDMTFGMAILYLALLGSSLYLFFVGLKPLQKIRESLAQVHRGEVQRLTGSFPNEVEPLVSELNTLLDDREHQVNRARHRAGNLAHGLKTPLTVLDAIASELEAKGAKESADDIRQATRDMHQFVERELMRSRFAANQRSANTLLLPVVSRITKALMKTSGGRIKDVRTDVDDSAKVPMDEGDLNELLGNLLENATKYANTRIDVSFSNGKIRIEDDGPGVPEAELQNIAMRGVRLDQHKHGSGLGLAIVQDLADAYGGALTFGRSNLGGLLAEFRFPVQDG